MRRLLTIECEEELLGGTLDEAQGEIGVLIVTGGSQTRIGSHRLFERLGGALASAGHPCMRFDRRGVGDSSGEDPGFRACGPDLAAAATELREHSPQVRRLIGVGLCDGATALALQGAAADLHGFILINPWLVEAEADAPAPAAIRQHYRQRLTSVEGWKKILTGEVSYGKFLKGVAKIAAPAATSELAAETADSLRRNRRPTAVILAAGDATAIAAANEMKAPPFDALVDIRIELDTDSHTFAKAGDFDRLLTALLQAIERLDVQP